MTETKSQAPPPPNRTARRVFVALFLVAAAACFTLFGGPGFVKREIAPRLGRPTTESRLVEIGPRAELAWNARLNAAGQNTLPQHLWIVVDKSARVLNVYGQPIGASSAQFLGQFAVTAASGVAGPKLREGDKQVPEGLYKIESLNPNSRYHLALRVNYPSAADQAAAAVEQRKDLGGDIMIHGGAASIGCVAIGDSAIEELFWLVAKVGPERVDLVFTPDAAPRTRITDTTPAWLSERYQTLQRTLDALRAGNAPPE